MYELSFYSLNEKAVDRFSQQMRNMFVGAGEGASTSLCSRLQIPDPLGTWQSVNGACSALQLFNWSTFQQRDKCYQSLRESDEWQFGMSNCIRTSEHWILTPTAGWTPSAEVSTMQVGGIHEFRIQNILNGSQLHASEAFRNTTAPVISALGGQILGQFDVSIGPERPTFITILAWPTLSAMHEGWYGVDRDSKILAQRIKEIEQFGRPLFERPNQFVTEPADWNVPNADLGFIV